MKKYWIGLSVIILIAFILIWSYKSNSFRSEVEYIPTDYEISLIEYFKEIGLKSEYYDNPEKVIKWINPMSLYIHKEGDYDLQMSFIEETVRKINQLTTDGFNIQITDDPSLSDSILYLCKKEEVLDLNLYFFEIINKVDYNITGYAYSEYVTKTSVIDRAIIFVSTEYSLEIQRATILEEITQSLGLASDSDRYSNSIFFKNKSDQEFRVQEYSKLDQDVIKLLYHSNIKPGMSSTDIDDVVLETLRTENF